MKPKRTYRFDGWELNLTSGELERGGTRIRLQDQPLRVLGALVESPGDVVTREQLIGRLWPDGVVDFDMGLNTAVRKLRAALGDTAETPRYIETLPRRGYRFIARLDPESERVAMQQATSDWPASTVDDGSSRDAVPTMSIAILPFTNLTGDPTKEYLGDAIADELINTLARDPKWFKVPARASAFAYKGRNIQIQQIARELDVKAVLEGSVRSGGDRIRISARLVDGLTGHHLWSRTYERECADLLELQDEIAVSIADVLSFGGSGLSSGVLKCPTGSLEAFKLFLQAKSLDNPPTEPNLRTALLLLDRALALDRNFARAWQGRAVIRGYFSVTMDYALPDALVEAERDARTALALDSNLGGAHAILGFIAACRGHWLEAEAAIATAHALLPKDPEIHLLHAVYVSQSAGHLQRGLEESRLACQLAPMRPVFTFNAGVAHLLAGQDKEALRFIQLAIASGLPESLEPVADALAHLAMSEGRYIDLARHITDTASPAERAAGAGEAVRSFCAALSDPSRKATAIAALRAFQDRLAAHLLTQVASKRLVVWYTRLNALDLAYETANSALDRLAQSDRVGMAWGIIWTPVMREFRRDARFQALVERLALTETRGKPRPSGRGRIAQTPKASCVRILYTEGSTAGHAERKACGANVRPEAHGSENTVKRPKAVAAKQEPAEVS